MVMVTPTQFSQDTRRPRPVGVACPSRVTENACAEFAWSHVALFEGVRGRDRTADLASARRGSVWHLLMRKSLVRVPYH
jgi:hypothetical protein